QDLGLAQNQAVQAARHPEEVAGGGRAFIVIKVGLEGGIVAGQARSDAAGGAPIPVEDVPLGPVTGGEDGHLLPGPDHLPNELAGGLGREVELLPDGDESAPVAHSRDRQVQLPSLSLMGPTSEAL